MIEKKINPFFIVGCMRTGTTLLRNILRTYPSLICPEETQFYRWSHTYHSQAFYNNVINNKVFKLHRKIDGVGEEEMKKILKKCGNKKQLMIHYIKAFAKNKKLNNYNWFDKSPQNILGILQLLYDFPRAKVVINFRDPIEVLASLKRGKVVKIEHLGLALNTWLQSSKISLLAKRKFANRIYLLNYDKLTNKTENELTNLCNFLNLDFEKIDYDLKKVVKKKYELNFKENEIVIVKKQCDLLFQKLVQIQN